MVDYQGTTGPQKSWEETYRNILPGELPWNAGMQDGDLKDLLNALQLNSGKAYDLGCGPGNDSVFLAQEGLEVTAVDIAASAVKLAQENAAKAGVEGKIHFVTGDVLELLGKADVALVHDRGCFHTLPSGRWKDYLRTVLGLLRKNGLLVLKVFSYKVPEGPGPYRFTPEELQGLFGGDFELVSLKEGVFHGPRKPFSLFCVFRKK